MTKVEAESGPELIRQIKADAHTDVFSDGMEVIGLAQSYIRLLKKEPKPAQSTKVRARGELINAQNRLAGTLNIIDFFASLDDSSHIGSIEPGK